MDISNKFYKDELINNSLLITINGKIISLKDFEIFSNKDIEINKDNLFLLFTYFNFFVGRIKSDKYFENLKNINNSFFSKDTEYGYDFFIKNKKDLMLFISKNMSAIGFEESQQLLEFCVNIEQYLKNHKDIGENFDKLFIELPENEKFTIIDYNNLMYQYSELLSKFVMFYITFIDYLMVKEIY